MIQKKYPFVHQQEYKDCGVACLSMVIKYYNGCIGEELLYDMTATGKQGTSAYHLIEAAKKIGMDARGIRCTLSDLGEIKLPCIAHTLIDNKYFHYIVIYKIDYQKKRLYVADPARKKLYISFEEFEKISSGVFITMVPLRKLPIYTNHITIRKYVIELIRRYNIKWIHLWIQTTIIMLLSLLSSFSFSYMIQHLSIKSISWFGYVALIFIVVSITKNIIEYVQKKMIGSLGCKIDTQLIIESFRNIIFLPYQFYCNRSTGEIAARIRDLESVGYGISKIIILIFMDTIMSIVSGVILYNLNRRLFLITVLWGIFYLIVIYTFKKGLKEKTEAEKVEQASLHNYIIESIKGFETIKGLCLENEKISDFSERYSNYKKKSYDLEVETIKQEFWKNIVSDIGYILLGGISCIEIILGNMELYRVLLYQSIVSYFLIPLEHFISMNEMFYEIERSLQRGLELFYKPEPNTKVDCGEIHTIDVKNLVYEREDSILENITLTIHPKEKILLMGSSGSGKSTLLKIIRGYFPISDGQIYLNGKDINTYSKESLAKRITYISQNEILFTDSICNNITLYRNISEKSLQKQIRLNCIDEISKKKILGLQDIIEEDGYNLSGGERQRIILARSLLKKSDVILIDEGFSQMDHNLERKILKRLFQNYSDKIIVVVSHRNNNMDLFDTYIEMRKGVIDSYITKPVLEGGCNV